jgi:hypothetical protein
MSTTINFVDAPTYFRNARVEMYRVELCADCVMMVANGEPGGDPEAFDMAAWSAGVEHNWPSGEGWSLGSGWTDSGDETDTWFSWQPCEGCGSTLGGDREYGHAGRELARVAPQAA